MARIPTWTELRLDATKLANLQKECYNSVHQLLDSALPELDRKMSSLNGRETWCVQKQAIKRTSPDIEMDFIEPQDLKQPSVPSTNEYQKLHVPDRRKNVWLVKKKVPSNVHETRGVQKQAIESTVRDELDFNRLEHLKPPPMPLSEYLRMHRPDVVKRAEKRVKYLKKREERRRFLASSKIVSSLEQIRISSLQNNNQPKNSHRRITAPEYQVKCKFTDREMKKLTAKIYERLPEVKKRKKEEDSKHMKALNYKNKLEYGRKLLENRRRGKIDYPLKVSNDDQSFVSSQDSFYINGYSGSVEEFSSDPYF